MMNQPDLGFRQFVLKAPISNKSLYYDFVLRAPVLHPTTWALGCFDAEASFVMMMQCLALLGNMGSFGRRGFPGWDCFRLCYATMRSVGP